MMNNMNLTPEMMEKAKNAANAEELMKLAKEHHIELTAQQAQTYFNALHNEKNGELNEDALDMVAGGAMMDCDYGEETTEKIKEGKDC